MHDKGDREAVGKRTGVSSAFGRQTIVESGVVRKICAQPSVSAPNGRLWVFSSIRSCPRFLDRLSDVVFESGSTAEVIGDSAFADSGLKSIVIPSSVGALGKGSFCHCQSLESVIFEIGSRLEQINGFAFSWTLLGSIVIPWSVVVLGGGSFYRCDSLEAVRFESGSRLERIDEYAFSRSGLRSIAIPSSVVVLGEGSFYECKSLESVTFDGGSGLKRIHSLAFCGSGLKSIEIPPSVCFLCGSAFVTGSLRSVSVSGENQHFRVHDSFLEDICGSTIYRFFGFCRSILIPSHIVVLGNSSFCECKSL
jgi:hypothetical protein